MCERHIDKRMKWQQNNNNNTTKPKMKHEFKINYVCALTVCIFIIIFKLKPIIDTRRAKNIFQYYVTLQNHPHPMFVCF